MTDIELNVREVEERLTRACQRAHRARADVRLLAVSKYVPVERMREAYELGIRDFGENHAQELREKQTFFEQGSCHPHFIGHLQTNKIKYVCGFVCLTESIDSLHLLDAMQKRSRQLDIVSDILIQVNIGDESQKGGVPVDELESFTDAALACSSLRLRGLMCVPPALSPEQTRPYFARMRALFDSLRSAYPDASIDTLSMGMSHDYDVAAEEGATQVRVGTALFGQRGRK